MAIGGAKILGRYDLTTELDTLIDAMWADGLGVQLSDFEEEYELISKKQGLVFLGMVVFVPVSLLFFMLSNWVLVVLIAGLLLLYRAYSALNERGDQIEARIRSFLYLEAKERLGVEMTNMLDAETLKKFRDDGLVRRGSDVTFKRSMRFRRLLGEVELVFALDTVGRGKDRFRGVLVGLTFPEAKFVPLLVRHDRGALNPLDSLKVAGATVPMDHDTEFDACFQVYSRDPEMAVRFLTDERRRRILDIADEKHGSLRMSYRESWIGIALSHDEFNQFFHGVWSGAPISDRRRYRQFFGELLTLLRFCDLVMETQLEAGTNKSRANGG